MLVNQNIAHNHRITLIFCPFNLVENHVPIPPNRTLVPPPHLEFRVDSPEDLAWPFEISNYIIVQCCKTTSNTQMDYWSNSTLSFGSPAFCTTNVGEFRRRTSRSLWILILLWYSLECPTMTITISRKNRRTDRQGNRIPCKVRLMLWLKMWLLHQLSAGF